MAEGGSSTGQRPDRKRERSGARGKEVATYLGGIAAVTQLINIFVDQWRLSPPASAVLVAFIVGSVALALGWSLLTRRRPSTLTIAVSIAGAAALLGAWLGPFAATSDEEDGQSEAEPDGGTGTPTPTGQPSPTPAGNRLCATQPEAPSQTWFLYEDAAADRRIVVEQDGRSPTSIPGVAFAAAGEHVVYATVTERTQVELMSLDTGELVGSKTLDGRVTDTTVSQDGEIIVLLEDLAGDNRLTLWRPSNNELRPIHDSRSTLSAPALSPSADRLAWIEGPLPGRLIVADLPTLAQQHELADEARDPAWSPDGTTVVYSAEFGDGQAIYATTPSEGGEHWRLTTPVQQMDDDPVVMPTCDGVVYARSQSGTVDLWQTHVDDDPDRDRGDDQPLPELAGAQSRPAFATK